MPAEAGKTKKVKLTGTLREPVTMKVGLNGRTEIIRSLPYVFEVPKKEFPVQLTFESPNFLYFDITVPKKAFDDTGHVYILKIDETAMAMNANRGGNVSQPVVKSMIEQERELRAEMALLHQLYYVDANRQMTKMSQAVTVGASQNQKSGSLLGGIGGMLKRKGYTMVYAGNSAPLRLPRNGNSFYVKAHSSDALKSIHLTPLNLSEGMRQLKLGKPDNIKLECDINYAVEEAAPGIFRISIPELAGGEYAFCQYFDNKLIAVFDFSIDSWLSAQNNPDLNPGELVAFFNGSGIPADNNNLIAQAPAAVSQPAGIIPASNPTTEVQKVLPKSDIDINIPAAGNMAENTFALVIANENYSRVADVPFALNDGRTVKEYLKKTFGLSDKAIIYVENATLNDMKYSVNRITEICDAYGADASLLIYYSGHGIPNEATGEGYLLPVDGYGTDPSTAYSLSEFYSTLGKLPTKRISLFMDACFSGTKRDGDILVAARGVAIKAKAEKPSGHIIAFSAAQGDQTAYPLADKHHGLMTYYLLKKIQETSGNVTMGELFDYVQDKVRKVSIVENGKVQVPSASVSPTLSNTWKDIKIK